MNYRDLEKTIQQNVQSALESYWNQTFEIDERDDYYSNSGMRYGYIAIDARERWVMVCDCTADEGDILIDQIRF